MGSTHKIFKGLFWTTLMNVVNAVYGFISVPLLLDYFGKANYGLIALAMSVNVYLNLLDLGLSTTTIRFYSKWITERDFPRVNKLFQTNLAFYGTVGLVNSAILAIVALFAEDIFSITPEQLVTLRHLFGVLIVSAFIGWYTCSFGQLLCGNELVGWNQKFACIPKLAQIVILWATLQFEFSIEWYYGLTTFSLLLLNMPFVLWKIRQVSPYVKFWPKWDWSVTKEILPYSMNVFSFSIFQYSFYNLRPVFLGMEGTVESVADFRILTSITGVVTMFSGMFLGVLLPSTSKAVANNDRAAYYRVAYEGTKYISIVLCFCCFGMMAVGKEAILLYVGRSYVHLVPWLLLWVACQVTSYNQAISSLILAGSDVRAITYSSICACLLGLGVTWWLIPYYEVGGAVIGYVVYVTVQQLFYNLYYWPVKMQISSKRVWRYSLLPYLILGLVLFVGIRYLDLLPRTYMNFFLKGGIFSVVYAVGCYFLINEEDKQLFAQLLFSKFKKR